MVLFMLGRDNNAPRFLQVKEAQASVFELGKSSFGNHGRRVVAGQRLMQATSDILLGWVRLKRTTDGVPRDFYLRQLWDWKLSAEPDATSPDELQR